MLDNLYPWQQQTWRYLVDAAQNNRLPHALLFVGEAGIGKYSLAQQFAHALLCQAFKTLGHRCGQCHSCQLSAHPDLLQVTPEAGSAIKVDSIREVTVLVNQTALLGGYRVIIINPAAAMNINAANALLKTLEEPTPKTLFILISNQGVQLPATIVSRCQKLILSKPTPAQGQAWLKEQIKDESVDQALLLKLAHGAPLKALDFFQTGAAMFRQDFYQGLQQLNEKKADPLELASLWQEKDLPTMLHLFYSWLNDLLRFKTIADINRCVNQDFQDVILCVGQQVSLSWLTRLIDHLLRINAYLRAGLNLNQRLLLEELLINYATS